MKNIKLIILATITMLFIGAFNLNAQEKEPQTVIIRVYETLMGKSKMYITQPNGETQTLDLESSRGDNMLKNDVTLQSQINNWKKQSFKIDGMTSYIVGDAAHVIMVILTKD